MPGRFKHVMICLFAGGCIVYPANKTVIIEADTCIDSMWNNFGDSVIQKGAHYWDGFGAHFKMPYEASPEELETAQKILIVCTDDLGGVGSHGPETFTAAIYDYNTGSITVSLKEFKQYDSVADKVVDNPEFIAKFAELFAHELGHALGFQHCLTDPKAVMYPMMNAVSGPDGCDYEQFCANQGPCEKVSM